MKLLKKVDERFEEVFLVGVLAAMVIIVFLQVCMRYVLKSSLPWSEELARYLFLWLIWVGAAYAAKKNKHISIDFIVTRLPKAGAKVVSAISFIIWLLFAIFLAYMSLKLTAMIFDRGQVSAAMRMPMWIAYASVPCGMILMIFRMIQNLIHDLRKGGDVL